MKIFTLNDAAAWMSAELIGDSVDVRSVTTDTREVADGSLFIALRGERFDGHDFCRQAQDSGCIAIVVERLIPEVSVPQLLVADTLCAYGALANGYRKNLDVKIVAITGSAGKTTVKQMCASILAQQGETIFTHANFNNEIGVPKTILSISETAEYAVVEMGAAKPHDISYLCRIAEPDVVAVNNVLEAHIEGFGSVEAVADTKGEIYQGVRPTGACVFVADSLYLSEFTGRAATTDHVLVGVGDDKRLDISATDIHLTKDGTASFVLSTPDGITSIALPVIGVHNVHNALVAAGLTTLVGASLTSIERGLASFVSAPGRMNVSQLPDNIVLIDDTYNANPGSMQKAIDSLVSLGKEAWLVSGHMAELGEDEVAMHKQIGQYAKDAGVARLFTVGDLAKWMAEAFGENASHFQSQSDLIEALKRSLQPSIAILVKGSRSAKMGAVVRELIEKG